MTLSNSPNLVWAANALLALVMGVCGWNINREYDRNDDQDRRIQAVERAIVKLDFMSDDLKEIKSDVKRLNRDRSP